MKGRGSAASCRPKIFMKDLSMHVLDIASNSVRAEAANVIITVSENVEGNQFIFRIEDDGKGIAPEMLKDIKNPFTTSRKLRKVGLGIPLLNDNCLLCDGYLDIKSEVGKGTTLEAMMKYDHIDRPPMGDMASTMCGLMTSNEAIEIKYIHEYGDESFDIATSEIKEALDGVPLTEIAVMKWLRSFIEENLQEIRG